MNRSVAVLILALIAAAGAIVLVATRRDPVPVPAREVVSAAPAPAAAPRAEAPLPRPTPVPTATAAPTPAPAAEPPLLLRGRVVSSVTGEPIAGAWVIQQEPLSAEVLAIADARTDAAGEYALPLSLLRFSEIELPVLVRVEAQGHASVVRSLGEEPDIDEPADFVLGPGGSVRGRVMDTAGKPIGGARVGVANGSVLADQDPGIARQLAYSSTARSEADGSFELRGIPEGTEVLLPAAAPGYRPAVEGPVPAGAEGVVFHLRPATAVVRGTLYRSKDEPEPMPGVSLSMNGIDMTGGESPRFLAELLAGLQEAVTDEAGRFEFRGMAEGTVPLALVKTNRGTKPILSPDAPLGDGEVRKMDLFLDHGSEGLAKLTVVDLETSAPIRDVVISRYADTTRRTGILARTDGRGQATVPGGGYLWLLPPEGWVPNSCNTHRLDEDPDNPGQLRATIGLERGGMLRGLVVDPEGRPAPRVRVRSKRLADTRTDREGAFAIAVRLGEAVTLDFDSPLGYAVEEFSAEAIASGEEQVVVLLPHGSVSGIARTVDGAPVPYARMSLVQPGAADLDTAADASGRYAFERVRAGAISVSGEADGPRGKLRSLRPREPNLALAEGERRTGVETVLHETRDVDIRFVDEAGEPVTPLPIMLEWIGPDGEPAECLGFRTRGDKGIVRFRGVPAAARGLRLRPTRSIERLLDAGEFPTVPESMPTVRIGIRPERPAR